MSAASLPFDDEEVALDEVEVAALLLPSDDWLCAAINALIISGEIGAQLPELTDEVAPLVALLPLPIANGLVAPCAGPVLCVDEDDLALVRDWITSSALDTAPRANNIAQLQPVRHAATNVLQVISANVVPAQKAQ